MIELDDKKIFGKIIALYSDVYFVVLVQPNLLKITVCTKFQLVN